jgi:hypothetical protein
MGLGNRKFNYHRDNIAVTKCGYGGGGRDENRAGTAARSTMAATTSTTAGGVAAPDRAASLP